MLKVEQLTAYWAWSEFTKLVSKLKIELKNLRIFTPNLQQQLQNLLYAYGLNLTEHRTMVLYTFFALFIWSQVKSEYYKYN